MPRDISGNYTRVVPPGASGYVNNTTIDETQVNGEINDIGNELTNSLTASGTKTPTANLPMGNFVHTGLGQATAAGQTVRFNVLQQGSDIAVSASGIVTIPAEGSLFNLTAVSAFNITGFSSNYNGRAFAVRFNPDKLLKLVDSSTFRLIGRTDRITYSGEIAYFYRESGGSYTEIGMQPLLDLSSYSGADIPLAIGQSAFYSISAATSLALRIATLDNQGYEIDGEFSYVAPQTTTGTDKLLVNNAALGSALILRHQVAATGSAAANGAQANDTSFLLGAGGSFYGFTSRISTKTVAKTCRTQFMSGTAAVTALSGILNCVWADTGTAWTSLGTLNFDKSQTGRIIVTRKS